MKNLLFIVAVAFTSIAQCQSNIISETEYNNIKINNITLSAIKATEGDETQIRDLIPAIIEKSTIDNEDNAYSYEYDGFEIAFSDSSGTTGHSGIDMFKITKNTWSITIQGKTVTIGSDISELGSVVFNIDADGSKSIMYQYCNGCNNFIYIEFNQTTNKITEIGYIEMT